MTLHLNFYITNILRHIWKSCAHAFSPAVVSKCFKNLGSRQTNEYNKDHADDL